MRGELYSNIMKVGLCGVNGCSVQFEMFSSKGFIFYALARR